jgi:hypothetical protein
VISSFTSAVYFHGPFPCHIGRSAVTSAGAPYCARSFFATSWGVAFLLLDHVLSLERVWVRLLCRTGSHERDENVDAIPINEVRRIIAFLRHVKVQDARGGQRLLGLIGFTLPRVRSKFSVPYCCLTRSRSSGFTAMVQDKGIDCGLKHTLSSHA